ncbi:unnamed protein product [Bursaphelenchus okinawaensis]|uniref:Protein farnesyltransferase subunit beta n=1 Tax=Bursaphelenchus okinawaensis TaxID=465554 RepID=A0A811L547_9BILA|nr:unnamed protein product [Bursaphelenchus okinawaensis]CAG9117693.1 unnamed protein product [Bursaphelenchus okinawaensis]
MEATKESQHQPHYESELGYHIGDPRFACDDQDSETVTSTAQKINEARVTDILDKHAKEEFYLNKEPHIKWFKENIALLPNGYAGQESSRTWFCFWCLHGLKLLGYKLTKEEEKQFIVFLKSCQNPEGGFGGAPGNYSHMATTYAAVMSLVTIGTEEALAVIDRKKLIDFYWTMKLPDGSFMLHETGEIDVRAVYCMIACCYVCGIMNEPLFEGVAGWLTRCQTYEGGFAGAPDCEAHGGYTLCGAAALVLLEKGHLIDAEGLLRFCAFKQLPFEGGFSGRTCKLVDTCYSYWVGASAIIAQTYLNPQPADFVAFNPKGLEEYILFACQCFSGGFRDKPGKCPDPYHSCYALAGLSLAQHQQGVSPNYDQPLSKLNVLLNVCEEQFEFAVDYFTRNPL